MKNFLMSMFLFYFEVHLKNRTLQWFAEISGFYYTNNNENGANQQDKGDSGKNQHCEC